MMYQVDVGNDFYQKLSTMRASKSDDFAFKFDTDEIESSKSFAKYFSGLAKERIKTSPEANEIVISHSFSNSETKDVIQKLFTTGIYSGSLSRCVCKELFTLGTKLENRELTEAFYNILKSEEINCDNIDEFLECAEVYKDLGDRAYNYIAKNFHTLREKIPDFVSAKGLHAIEAIANDPDLCVANEDEYASVILSMYEKDKKCISMIRTIKSPFVSPNVREKFFKMYNDFISSQLNIGDIEDFSNYNSFIKNILLTDPTVCQQYSRRFRCNEAFKYLSIYPEFHSKVDLPAIKAKQNEFTDFIKTSSQKGVKPIKLSENHTTFQEKIVLIKKQIDELHDKHEKIPDNDKIRSLESKFKSKIDEQEEEDKKVQDALGVIDRYWNLTNYEMIDLKEYNVASLVSHNDDMNHYKLLIKILQEEIITKNEEKTRLQEKKDSNTTEINDLQTEISKLTNNQQNTNDEQNQLKQLNDSKDQKLEENKYLDSKISAIDSENAELQNNIKVCQSAVDYIQNIINKHESLAVNICLVSGYCINNILKLIESAADEEKLENRILKRYLDDLTAKLTEQDRKIEQLETELALNKDKEIKINKSIIEELTKTNSAKEETNKLYDEIRQNNKKIKDLYESNDKAVQIEIEFNSLLRGIK